MENFVLISLILPSHNTKNDCFYVVFKKDLFVLFLLIFPLSYLIVEIMR
jgi:hypothetical protein